MLVQRGIDTKLALNFSLDFFYFSNYRNPVKMSETADDMRAYSMLTDSIFYQILQDPRPELETSRDILQKILLRKLYKHIGHTKPGHFKEVCFRADV